MCHKTICNKCKKWTWSGCGRHINEALAGIAPKNICKCIRNK